MEKCDELCCHSIHSFIYKLSNTEKKSILDVGNKIHNLFYNIDPKWTPKKNESMQLVNNEINTNLLQMHNKFKIFFDNNKGVYFIRMNTISPKDVSMFLEDNNSINSNENNEVDDKYDEPMIRNDINYLKINTENFESSDEIAKYCIQILCHSERIKLDIQYEKELIGIIPLNIILLPWKDINISTETRCFIKSNKLIAISQYYLYLNDSYTDIEKTYQQIISFFDSHKNNLPIANLTMDIYFKYSSFNNKEIDIIEYNYYEDSDKCFFDDEELMFLENKSNDTNFMPPFRFKNPKNNIETYNLFI